MVANNPATSGLSLRPVLKLVSFATQDAADCLHLGHKAKGQVVR